jgi:hypothetical protein
MLQSRSGMNFACCPGDHQQLGRSRAALAQLYGKTPVLLAYREVLIGTGVFNQATIDADAPRVAATWRFVSVTQSLTEVKKPS